jgi:hypothetical protein
MRPVQLPGRHIPISCRPAELICLRRHIRDRALDVSGVKVWNGVVRIPGHLVGACVLYALAATRSTKSTGRTGKVLVITALRAWSVDAG